MTEKDMNEIWRKRWCFAILKSGRMRPAEALNPALNTTAVLYIIGPAIKTTATESKSVTGRLPLSPRAVERTKKSKKTPDCQKIAAGGRKEENPKVGYRSQKQIQDGGV